MSTSRTEDLSHLTEEERRLVVFSRRYDLRNIIGLVMAVYGVVAVVMGLLNGEADRAQAAGIAINLWTGVPLVLVGVVFFWWARLSPRPVSDLVRDEEEQEESQEEGTRGA